MEKIIDLHLILKLFAMTNKEILQADLLDILFEHRNKLYGAYALRKTYSRRLGFALALHYQLFYCFILMSFINKKDRGEREKKSSDTIVLRQFEMPQDKPKEPDPPRDKPKPQAQEDYQAPKIEEDVNVKNYSPDLNAIQTTQILVIKLLQEKPGCSCKNKNRTRGTG
jgi:protein TonB